MLGPTLIAAALLSSACASLGGLGALVQAPTFSEARDQPAEVTLQPPSASRPLGGAVIRLWTEIGNPNALGLSLGTLDGTLYLDGRRAARRDVVGYRLEGTIGVDAGALGQPTFGPMTLMRGDLR